MPSAYTCLVRMCVFTAAHCPSQALKMAFLHVRGALHLGDPCIVLVDADGFQKVDVVPFVVEGRGVFGQARVNGVELLRKRHDFGVRCRRRAPVVVMLAALLVAHLTVFAVCSKKRLSFSTTYYRFSSHSPPYPHLPQIPQTTPDL